MGCDGRGNSKGFEMSWSTLLVCDLCKKVQHFALHSGDHAYFFGMDSQHVPAFVHIHLGHGLRFCTSDNWPTEYDVAEQPVNG